MFPVKFQIFSIAYSCRKQCIHKSLKYSLFLIVVNSSVSRKVSNILYCLQLQKAVYPKKFLTFFIACSWKKECIQKISKYSLLLVVVESSVSRKFPNILCCLQLEKAVNPEMFQIFFIACSCKQQCIPKSFKYCLLLVVGKRNVSRKFPNILYCLQL